MNGEEEFKYYCDREDKETSWLFKLLSTRSLGK